MWCPVASTCGIAIYYALPLEPHLLVFGAALLVAGFCIWSAFSNKITLRLLIILFLMLGFVVAKARAVYIQPAALHATTPTTILIGTVEGSTRKPGGRIRLLLNLESAKGIKPGALPRRVLLSGRFSNQQLFYGDKVKVKGRLMPLPGPVQPRGYDYGRRLWFEGIGATGFIYGKFEFNEQKSFGMFSYKRQLQKFRQLIAERIAKVLPDRNGGLAIALITGDRGRLSKQDAENLRKSGLAHILAISGLHMSLVAGGMFWLVRAILALSGSLVLNYPIKKWAAISGIIAGAFYLVVSGASVATQRAFLMLLIMFVAILLNRPAISMRNLALAAMVIIYAHPESVVSSGFQMSFMAVAGLIGFYEFMRTRSVGKQSAIQERSALQRWLLKGGRSIFGIGVTTLIASIFTGLPAVYHFNRIAVYSLAGNIVALPVVSLIIMPGAILTILLMPFGLEFVGTHIMGAGIEIVMSHAEKIANLPNSQIHTPDLPSFSTLLIAFALLWACLWRGRLKAIAIFPLMVGLGTLNLVVKPDVFISKFGKNVAIRDANGALILVNAKTNKFATNQWLISNGETASPKQAAAKEGWQCHSNICSTLLSGKNIVYLKKGAQQSDVICAEYQIIISAEPLGKTCKSVPTRIDRFDLWREGSHTIFLGTTENKKAKPKIETAASYRGERPWVIKPIARWKILKDPQKDKYYKRRKKPAKPKTVPGKTRDEQRRAFLQVK